MKPKTLIHYLILIIAFSIFGVAITFQALTNQSIISPLFSNAAAKIPPLITVETCTDQKPLDLSGSSDPHIRRLQDYQTVCDSFVTNKLMIFTDMPNSTLVAEQNAQKMAQTLKEFSSYGITPIVIVEPTSNWGLIDFNEFKTGFYNNWIIEYFQALNQEGITHQQMGTWVPFPEANIPTWNKLGTSPADFSAITSQYIALAKQTYPDLKTSILLNSATYDNTDYDWAYGEYISLLPFVKNINPNSVNSFGLQGFPWLPRNTASSNPLTDPSQYLNHLLATEVADSLPVKEIWFNTGTFFAKYTQTPTDTAYLSFQERKTILDQTIDQALLLKERGYTVWINLFAEDKSLTQEQTDWSYFTTPDGADQHAQVLKHFIRRLHQEEIGFALFDRTSTPPTDGFNTVLD